MRQVPTYLIIGNGRIARHFCHYFSLLKIKKYSQWHRSEPLELLHERAAQATHILVLIKDSAIEPFIDAHLAAYPAKKIHFSGSLVSKKAYGAHPLMTFGPELYTLEKYLTIPFVVDAKAPVFSELLPNLHNPNVRLSAKQKAKYHAMCVLAGNFTCILWQKFFGTLTEEFVFPPHFGDLYLRQQMENLIRDYKTALTGPLARGDAATIKSNLDALKGDAFHDVYQSFVRAYNAEKTAPATAKPKKAKPREKVS